jgi:hypothetical protein
MPEVTEIFEKFFESVMPQMFQTVTEVFPVSGMEGTTFTVVVNLTGENGTTYGITITDAKELTITPGGLDDPMLTVELPASLFVDMIKNTVASPMPDLYNAAKDVQGTIIFEPILKEGQPPLSLKLIMNQAEDPNIKLSADVPTFMRLINGEESPPTAFMQGKIKIDGNMPFGMELMTKFQAFMPGMS